LPPTSWTATPAEPDRSSVDGSSVGGSSVGGPTSTSSAQQGNHHHRPGRVPHQLLCRVDDATGYERGYDVITLTDCTAATSVEEHDNAISYDYPMFSKPMTADALIEELR